MTTNTTPTQLTLTPVLCFPNQWTAINLREPNTITNKISDFVDRFTSFLIDDQARRDFSKNIHESVGAAIEAQALLWAGTVVPGKPYVIPLICVVCGIAVPLGEAESLIETMRQADKNTQVISSRLAYGIRQRRPLPLEESKPEIAMAQECVDYVLTDRRHDALVKISFVAPVVKKDETFLDLFDSLATTWWLVDRDK